MHWVDDVATQLLARGRTHVIASGTSISGEVHLGNAEDVLIADAVARAVRQAGGEGTLVWIADDVDPLRRTPEQVGEAFAQHLGKPVADLPSPGGDDGGFVHYFVRPFMEDLQHVGVAPTIRSGRQMYRDGTYEPATVAALRQGPKVREILERISGSHKGERWLPFDPICPRCGKIASTEALEVVDGGVRFVCSSGVAGKKRIEGCGHEGVCDLRSGKLTWRVEWAARWWLLGVTCEPFGKEHAAAGGSYDTAKVLVKEIFGYDPPLPVAYEHIQVGGAKMSKSLGNIVTLRDLLGVLPPEVIRYFFFRVRPTRHKEFDISNEVLHLVDEYEHCERLYFGIDTPSPQEDLQLQRRTYELSQVREGAPLPTALVQVTYRQLVTAAQVATGPWPAVKEVLGRTLDLSKMTDADEVRAQIKLAAVRGWLQRFAPENVLFSVVDPFVPTLLDPLDAAQRALLRVLADELTTITNAQWKGEHLHNLIHEATKAAGMTPAAGFGACYGVLLGKPRGPRLGLFLQELGRHFVVERLQDAAAVV